MKRAFFVSIAALALTGCTLELPDLVPPGFVSSSKPQPEAAAATPASAAPADRYQAGQSPDNTGDYSHYF
jgi:hypothetical protein